MRRIVLVRHGQTAHNRLRLIQGRADTELNEKGEEQARRLATELAETDFDRVYASPLSRALQTAQIIIEGRNLPITTDDRLLEIDQGDWTLGNVRELLTNNDRYKIWAEDPTKAGPPNGETIFDVADRSKSFVNDIEGNNVLVVAHGGVIAVMQTVLQSRPLEQAWELLPRNCEAIHASLPG